MKVGKIMENKKLIDERKRKAERIIELYACREYRQEDVAKELAIPLHIVAQVTKEYNYSKTKKVTSKNANEGQKRMMCRNFSTMEYLDKYNI